MTIPSRSNRTIPWPPSSAKRLVHALARRIDHRGQVALGQPAVDPDGTIGDVAGRAQDAAMLVREADQKIGHPAGHVQEVERLDPSDQAAQLAGQGCQEHLARTGVLCDQGHERRARDDDRIGRLEGHGRHRLGSAVEQGELAEERLLAQRGQDRLVAAQRRQDQLDRAVHDQVKRLTGIALVEDHLAGPVAAGAHRDRHLRQVAGLDPLEQAQRSQDLGRGPRREHVRSMLQLGHW